jgi:hypothetical protein
MTIAYPAQNKSVGNSHLESGSAKSIFLFAALSNLQCGEGEGGEGGG